MTDPNRSSSSRPAPEETQPSEASPSEDLREQRAAEAARVPEPFREAVSALQEQVRAAAATIRELRAENARLKNQVQALSQRPDVGEDDVFIHLDGERAELRERIQQFIDAIDDHLESAPSSGIGTDWPESPPEAPDLPPNRVDQEPNPDDIVESAPEDDMEADDAARNRVPDDTSAQNEPPAQNEPLGGAPGIPAADRSGMEPAEEGRTAADTTSDGDLQASGPPPGQPLLQDGLPEDGEFDVEVTDAAAERTGNDKPCCPDDDPYEPRTLSPGLQPRRSARRRR